MEIPARRSEPNSRRKRLLDQFINERNTAENERCQKRYLLHSRRRAQGETKDEMNQDCHRREDSNDACPATVENRDGFPKSAGRRLMPQLWRSSSFLIHRGRLNEYPLSFRRQTRNAHFLPRTDEPSARKRSIFGR